MRWTVNRFVLGILSASLTRLFIGGSSCAFPTGPWRHIGLEFLGGRARFKARSRHWLSTTETLSQTARDNPTSTELLGGFDSATAFEYAS